jgi:zinc-binding alcohol dehydrogenase family protein
MKAVGNYKSLPTTDPECFVEITLPDPKPTGRDLLVRVLAVSVNPVDTGMRGNVQPDGSEPRIVGWDASGIVEAVGENVTLFKPGDEVFYAGSIARAGCNSELHLIDERIVGRKPTTLSYEQAAAMPLTTLTAWEALFVRMGIEPKPSERNAQRKLLIIGGAGGVGSIAIQLAKRVAGLYVIATASRPETIEWCKKMGADEVINHRQPLKDGLAAIGIKEVSDALCCSNFGEYVQQLPEVVEPFGFACTIIGTKDDTINVGGFIQKSIALGFEFMYTRSLFETKDMQAQHDILNEASHLLDAGVLQCTLTESFGPLNPENLRLAHARVETRSMIGKLALSGIQS